VALSASSQTCPEYGSEHRCIAVLNISGSEHQCHRASARSSPEFGQQLAPGIEFTHVPASKFIEAVEVVLVPVAKSVAWSEFSCPFINPNLVSRKTTRPETVDEDTIAIGATCSFIRTLYADVHFAPSPSGLAALVVASPNEYQLLSLTASSHKRC
jgi:hypothetical protein